MITDPIADYLTRIRNAVSAKHRMVEVPSSNLSKNITKILFEKGYILNYKFEEDKVQGILQKVRMFPLFCQGQRVRCWLIRGSRRRP